MDAGRTVGSDRPCQYKVTIIQTGVRSDMYFLFMKWFINSNFEWKVTHNGYGKERGIYRLKDRRQIHSLCYNMIYVY